jgi:hypothetical protein
MSAKLVKFKPFCLAFVIGKILEHYLSKVLQITKTRENEYK